jgi:hypothetical protein
MGYLFLGEFGGILPFPEQKNSEIFYGNVIFVKLPLAKKFFSIFYLKKKTQRYT